MKVSVRLENEFIPSWNGNEEDESPIVVVHKRPTIALRDKLIPKPRLKIRVTPGANGEEQAQVGETEVVIDNRRLVEEMVTEIKNLVVEIPDSKGEVKEREITKGTELFADWVPAELGELADEIGRHLQSALSHRVDSKN